jgi:hypothetical protein
MSRRYRSAHPCPTATKTGYPDRETAERALASILEELARAPRAKRPARTYRCTCGRWHLTSKPS